MQRFIHLLILGVLLAASGGCDLLGGEDGPPFPWLRERLEFNYDFYPVAETLSTTNYKGEVVRFDTSFNAGPRKLLTIRISYRNDLERWMLHHIYPCAGCSPPPAIRPSGSYSIVTREEDGLYVAALKDCSVHHPSGPEDLRFLLRVPARPPRIGTKLRFWTCRGDRMVPFASEVIDTEETVTAADGDRYETYVLETKYVGNEATAFQREYWNEQDGLVKIELFREDGAVIGYYVLSTLSVKPES